MFDKMLDLKLIETDQLQLMALTTLWITLKRIHIISNVPSVSFVNRNFFLIFLFNIHS